MIRLPGEATILRRSAILEKQKARKDGPSGLFGWCRDAAGTCALEGSQPGAGLTRIPGGRRRRERRTTAAELFSFLCGFLGSSFLGGSLFSRRSFLGSRSLFSSRSLPGWSGFFGRSSLLGSSFLRGSSLLGCGFLFNGHGGLVVVWLRRRAAGWDGAAFRPRLGFLPESG